MKKKKSIKDSGLDMIESFANIFEASNFDIDTLSEMFDLYRQFYKQKSDISGARKFISERIKENDSKIYIANDELGQSCGFVQLYPLFTSVGMKKMYLLNDLFVKKEYRGKGISKQLIDQCKEFAKENFASGLMLETTKDNKVGNQLYPATGFNLIDESNFYFWKN